MISFDNNSKKTLTGVNSSGSSQTVTIVVRVAGQYLYTPSNSNGTKIDQFELNTVTVTPASSGDFVAKIASKSYKINSDDVTITVKVEYSFKGSITTTNKQTATFTFTV